jgi:hypothetical protein
MMGLHVQQGDWSVMAHGFVNAIYDKQTHHRRGIRLPRGSRSLAGHRIWAEGALHRVLARRHVPHGRHVVPHGLLVGRRVRGLVHLHPLVVLVRRR